MDKFDLYGFSNFERAEARERELVPSHKIGEGTRSAYSYFNKSHFANAENFATFTADDIPQPKGKRIV